jgi:uncharacterized protein YndB with AHSA1/START domain
MVKHLREVLGPSFNQASETHGEEQKEMTDRVCRTIDLPYCPDVVWQEIATDSGLAQWMYPNDFIAKVGHRFTFDIPPNPSVGFEGLTVRCEVIECVPPSELVFTWSAGAPVENTKVSFRLEATEIGTRLHFEHSGFDLSHPFGKQAFGGAKFGWDRMIKRLEEVLCSKQN